ncbi:TM2 domain-containing protein [Corynebacterium comes]|uniref:TM2 domain protein n=1 Tax=Corynebacterium comes TaxID=2675218 RepID=A0A6B8VK88_9CORY|nr:TM2 domain-containing protein [Corynebacterium comes]QGU04503.1 TM2 domain protein [Corynebacterium comes]
MSMPFDQNQYGHQGHYDKDGLPVAPPTYLGEQRPAPHTPMYVALPQVAQQKSWVVAVLLAFFLGTLGVHNFYLGNTGRGVAQLSLTVLGWVTAIIIIGFFFLAIVGLWALIDFVLILLRSGSMSTDSRGVPLN